MPPSTSLGSWWTEHLQLPGYDPIATAGAADRKFKRPFGVTPDPGMPTGLAGRWDSRGGNAKRPFEFSIR